MADAKQSAVWMVKAEPHPPALCIIGARSSAGHDMAVDSNAVRLRSVSAVRESARRQC